jgi:hypothetical protein
VKTIADDVPLVRSFESERSGRVLLAVAAVLEVDEVAVRPDTEDHSVSASEEVDEVLKSAANLIPRVVARPSETLRPRRILLAVAVIPKVQQVAVFVDAEELAFVSQWSTIVNQLRAVATIEDVPHAHSCLLNPAPGLGNPRSLAKYL